MTCVTCRLTAKNRDQLQNPTLCNWVLATHTHTHLTALFPGLPRWPGTRKVKPIWILLKQETVSGSGISWAICKSVPSSRQITTPAPHHSLSFFKGRMPFLLPNQQRQSTSMGYLYLFKHSHHPMSEQLSLLWCCCVSILTISVSTTTTTIVLQPLYRSTCLSQHLQLRTGGFCWCKVLLPAFPCWR